MTNTARALYDFFSGFGLPAYVENTVPDDAALPYITYELLEPDSLDRAPFHARIWYRSTSYAGVSSKADEIRAAIDRGYSTPIDGGVLWIWRDDNFLQFQPSDEPELKLAYLSMILAAYND